MLPERLSVTIGTEVDPVPELSSDCLVYAIESPERAELSETVQKMKAEFPATIPNRINGLEIKTKQSRSQVNPSRHKDIVANYALATSDQLNTVVDAVLKAKPAREATPFEDRAAIFLRACELVAGKYRSEMVAATMLGQGKNIWQAEIDALAETFDFFRYYVQEAWPLYSEQPKVHPDGNWNNSNTIHFWFLHKILLEAGLPENVIQFLPGDAEEVTNTTLKRPEFSALTFIGSTATFKSLQKKNSYPRVVGETGGKNWGVVHSSADVSSAALNIPRAAFEYQGQKCSANSRVYVAESVWPEFQRHPKKETEALKVGDVEDYANFVNPVIYKRSFDKLNEFIEAARTDSELELIIGSKASKEKWYYVHPTIYKTSNPRHDIMKRELFGPILGVYVYPDAEWEETLKLIDTTSRYGLTGSIYAKDPYASRQAQTALKHAAGMLYLNTKCTGSTVAQQPFDGSRDSGTNDKTGTMAHLQRFVSTRTMKEKFVPLKNLGYPSNEV
ncbi:Aldehyde/histidinol dehydrogenase [Aspergillus transmontanensis]|uniref:L-glutamate gamma-semialdehyde dehydrogenase n=1 Tax=Aspergillus transmontanensis TaxID=1034304 RepID=A0A5N6VLZ1_9EURO|nr:Aldehyde/histidinol dehydrogenase [Aspergillus transmontanensis]